MSDKQWLILFWVLVILTIIDLVVPDPLPILDELVLLIGTGVVGVRSVKNK